MRTITALYLIMLILAGCDTYRGPFINNSSGVIVHVKIMKKDGSFLEATLPPDGQIALGGPRGSAPLSIEEVSVYDEEKHFLETINIDAYEISDVIYLEKQ